MSDELALAMCWYDEKQWDRLKEMEPEALDDTYETWRKNATRALHELRQAGHNIQKVSIKIDDFLGWCEDNGVESNAESRSAYAAWKLKQKG
jgi:hypothetical protein